MRYLVAIIVSMILISIVWILMIQIERLQDYRWRQGFIAAKERGAIPADADIDTAAFGTEAAGIEVVAFGICSLWKTFRILFIPLIITVCLALAWFTSKSATQS